VYGVEGIPKFLKNGLLFPQNEYVVQNRQWLAIEAINSFGPWLFGSLIKL
jgi:hypothetical protein